MAAAWGGKQASVTITGDMRKLLRSGESADVLFACEGASAKELGTFEL